MWMTLCRSINLGYICHNESKGEPKLVLCADKFGIEHLCARYLSSEILTNTEDGRQRNTGPTFTRLRGAGKGQCRQTSVIRAPRNSSAICRLDPNHESHLRQPTPEACQPINLVNLQVSPLRYKDTAGIVNRILFLSHLVYVKE